MQRTVPVLPVLNGRREVKQVERILQFVKDKQDVDSNTKQLVAIALFIACKNGSSIGTPPSSQSWADYFSAVIKGNNTPDQTLAPDEEKANLYLAYALGVKPLESWADSFLPYCFLFTSIRLGGVRTNRVLTLEAFTNSRFHTHSLTGGPYGFFSTLQLSYGPELFACCVKLVQKWFRPETHEDRNKHEARPWYLKWKSWYDRFESQRFKQIFFSREFASAFTNALVWLFWNVICYVKYPTLCLAVAVCNLIAFGFDIWHDIEFPKQELEENTEFLDLSEPLSKDNVAPLNTETIDLLKKLQLDNHTTLIENAVHDKIHGTKGNWYTGIKYRQFRTKWVAIGLFVAMILVYAPVIIPALPTFLPALAGGFVSPVLPIIPGVFHFLAHAGALMVVSLGNPEIYKSIGVILTIGFGVAWASLGARLRSQIDWTNSQTRWDSFIKLGKNVLGFVALCVAFYVATSFVPVWGLIIAACIIPNIPFIKKKIETKHAETTEFDKLSDHLPVPAIPIQLYGTTMQFSKENIESGVLDIQGFLKLTPEQKNAFWKASGLVHQDDRIEFLKNLTKQHAQRDPSSTKIINRILTKLPVNTIYETPDFGMCFLDAREVTEDDEYKFSDSFNDSSISNVEVPPAPPSSPISINSTCQPLPSPMSISPTFSSEKTSLTSQSQSQSQSQSPKKSGWTPLLWDALSRSLSEEPPSPTSESKMVITSSQYTLPLSPKQSPTVSTGKKNLHDIDAAALSIGERSSCHSPSPVRAS